MQKKTHLIKSFLSNNYIKDHFFGILIFFSLLINLRMPIMSYQIPFCVILFCIFFLIFSLIIAIQIFFRKKIFKIPKNFFLYFILAVGINILLLIFAGSTYIIISLKILYFICLTFTFVLFFLNFNISKSILFNYAFISFLLLIIFYILNFDIHSFPEIRFEIPTLGSYNSSAFILSLFAIPIFKYRLYYKNSLFISTLDFVIVLIVFCIFYSLSRATFICFFIGIIVQDLYDIRKVFLKKLPSIIIIFIFFYLVDTSHQGLFLSRFINMSDYYLSFSNSNTVDYEVIIPEQFDYEVIIPEQNFTGSGRLLLWSQSIFILMHDFPRFLFGAFFGAELPQLYLSSDNIQSSSHNLFLDLILYYGIIITSLILFGFFKVIKVILYHLKNKRRKFYFLSIILMILINCLFDNNIFVTQTLWIYSLLFSFMMIKFIRIYNNNNYK